MANKTIHQLNAMNEFDSGDEFAVYDTSANTTGKMTIANVLGTSITGLGTTATTIPGAISELNTGLGSVNILLGSGDISSIGDGSVTGAISSLNNDKVSKTGDNITGSLYFYRPTLNNPTSTFTRFQGSFFTNTQNNSNSTAVVSYSAVHNATDDLSANIYASRDVNGTNKYHNLYIGVKANGDPYVSLITTPWLDALGLTPTQWTTFAGNNCACRKQGNVVVVTGGGTFNVEIPANTNTKIGKLPDTLKPGRTIYCAGACGNHVQYPCRILINTSGEVQVLCNTAITAANSYITFGVSFII